MIHFPVQLALVLATDALHLSRALYARPTTFLAFVGLVLALSVGLYRRFEMPMQALLRRRLLDRRSTSI
jgi:peptidoglycan/LPS O-acetylase OafA/YrhL